MKRHQNSLSFLEFPLKRPYLSYPPPLRFCKNIHPCRAIIGKILTDGNVYERLKPAGLDILVQQSRSGSISLWWGGATQPGPGVSPVLAVSFNVVVINCEVSQANIDKRGLKEGNWKFLPCFVWKNLWFFPRSMS